MELHRWFTLTAFQQLQGYNACYEIYAGGDSLTVFNSDRKNNAVEATHCV